MLTVAIHGTTLHFDDTGFDELPYVYRPLTRGRVYEQDFLEHIRTVGRRGAYVDVGAHVGTHTVWFAAMCPATRVHAFEPVSRFAQVVRRNLAANDVEGRVVVYEVGLSDTPGQATNRLSPEHQMGFDADPGWVEETFPIARLDDVLYGSEPVAVIKLDVEGMEPAVLRGARRILSRHRPHVYAEAKDAAAVAEITRTLRPYGYRPTGRVFNASPTHEFTAPARRGLEWLRPVWIRIPARLRRRLAGLTRG